MSRLLALCFEVPASPAIVIKRATSGEGLLPRYGWGLAWYPPGERGAVTLKDPASRGEDAPVHRPEDRSRPRSAIFLGHLRGAARRVAQEDTHPFVQRHAGRHWVMTHSGQLREGYRRKLDLGPEPADEPLGHTDTEHALAWLLMRLRGLGARSVAEVEPEALRALLGEINALGTANLLLSDGLDVVAYQDAGGYNPLCWVRARPPHAGRRIEDAEILLDLFSGEDVHRSAVVVATGPLPAPRWVGLEPGRMLILRRGAVRWDSAGSATRLSKPSGAREPAPAPGEIPSLLASQQAATMVEVMGAGPAQDGPPAPAAAPGSVRAAVGGADAALYRVFHETVYAYADSVEQSAHVVRLRPVSDRFQDVLEHSLEVSPEGESQHFEDVFGNEALKLDFRSPYRELRLTSRALVRVSVPADRPLHSPTRRITIPLVWMPWQRQMMSPYLLPEELPEIQLRELFDYAMSFVERQDYDLTETLLDINRTIYGDYAYVQGSTTVETTPFEVYTARRGVCQDFANLLICLARLLGIPARYRVGYIHTSADYENRMQSDASHAWAELYLPWFGWLGLDPTNGCLVGRDHVRVACGRHYRDATPTSGTIVRGGGAETLTIAVRVERVEPAG